MCVNIYEKFEVLCINSMEIYFALFSRGLLWIWQVRCSFLHRATLLQCILTRTALYLAGAQSTKPNRDLRYRGSMAADEYVHEYYNVYYDS
jgi:hypothetical protein